MSEKKIDLFFFIDAFGWKLLEEHPQFLKEITVDRKPLDTILGYSSACDPSIISGLRPSEHLLWSSFYYSPSTCQYKWAKWLKLLPKALTDNHRIRHQLSSLIKKMCGFTGYFQIYNVPFDKLPLFDYAEKKRIWAPKGLPQGKTIFDILHEKKRPYYVGDQHNENEQIAIVEKEIKTQSLQFAYLLFGKLDAKLHSVGTKDKEVDAIINHYDKAIKRLVKLAKEHYEEVNFYVFSDHGMHDVKETINLQALIERLNLSYGKDYIAFYDSTMARFWFLNDNARTKITQFLENQKKGKVLANEELSKLGVYFSDKRYGELIFLLNSGVLIVPSFMGKKAIKGMHGYHPHDKESLAMITSNRLIPSNVTSIEKIYSLFNTP